MQKLRHVAITARVHVMKCVERFHQTAAHLAAVVSVEGYAHNLEPGAIVQLEELGDQIGSGMAVKNPPKGNDPKANKARPRAAPHPAPAHPHAARPPRPLAL